MQALPGHSLGCRCLAKWSAFACQGHGTDLILILTHLKADTPSTEIDDLSTLLYKKEGIQREKGIGMTSPNL